MAAGTESASRGADSAWRELQALLDEEVVRLPEKYRAPFVLCCLEGRSRTETATALGLPKGTVSSRIANARRLLEQRLARRGVSLSAALTAGALWSDAAAAEAPAALVRTTVALALGRSFGPISPTVAALANGPPSAAKLFTSLALILATVLGVLGYQLSAAVPAPEAPKEHTENKRAAAPPERLDLDGDPLLPDVLTRLGRTRFWCADACGSVAYSKDGSKILAAGYHGVSVYDSASGKQLHHISSAERVIDSTSLSPDGRYLALGMERGIQIWDLSTGRLLREFNKDDEWVPGVLFSPDGKLLASFSSSTKSVYLWDPATGDEIRRWPVSPAWDNLAGFTFSPDSKTLIVGDERTIRFWDTATGKEVLRIADHPGARICSLVLTGDGKILASQAHTGGGNLGGSRTRDKKVYLWDAATGKMLRHIEVSDVRGGIYDTPEIYDFQFSPDSKSLTTASGYGELRVWDVASGKELRHWNASDGVHWIASAPDGKTLASHGVGDNIIRLWDVATGKERHPSHRHGIHALDLSPDGRTLASAGRDSTVLLWDSITGKQLHQLTAARGTVGTLHFSADGRSLTALGDDGKARIWDVATGKELPRLPAPVKGEGCLHVLSPDGKTWASAASDLPTKQRTHDIVLWDASTGAKRPLLVGDGGYVSALAFSPDSGTLYSWSGSKIRFWDVATGKQLRELRDVGLPLYTGGFSPDGNWFACVGLGGPLLLYDMATGKLLHELKVSEIHTYYPPVAFSPDCRTLAVGDANGTIHLVELASGKFRRHLAGGHQGKISALHFSADGRRLISGSSDTTALVWDLTGRLNAKPKPLSATELESHWNQLASSDAEAADQSIRSLAASAAEALPYLEKKLQPVASADAKRVAELIRDLGNDQFAVREQASKELEKLGETATAMVRKALATDVSSEVHVRLEAMLKKQDRARRSPSPQRLQVLRTLEVLEFAGTPEARQRLQKLADGAAESFITREAKAALKRVAQQPVIGP
jgi:WD40 repeat protein